MSVEPRKLTTLFMPPFCDVTRKNLDAEKNGSELVGPAIIQQVIYLNRTRKLHLFAEFFSHEETGTFARHIVYS